MLCEIACTHIPHSLNVSLQPAVKTVFWARLCPAEVTLSLPAAHLFPSPLIFTLSQQEITEMSQLREDEQRGRETFWKFYSEGLVSLKRAFIDSYVRLFPGS